MIDSSTNILFHLLRLALGNKVECCLSYDIDWRNLIDLSFDQGVAAIAIDGLQKFIELNPDRELSLDSPELEDIKYEWFGATLQAEENFLHMSEAVQSLSNKIPIVILKGLCIARYYPIPAHRESVDLDVFGFKHIGLEQIEPEIIRDDYKHMGFMYKGVMVEYHKSLIAWKSLKGGKSIEKTLREALGTTEGIYPSDYFNALFLTIHSYTHFLLEDGISLKHIIDWYLSFNISEDRNLKERVLATLETFGIREFAEAMTRVAEYVCKDSSTALTKTDSRMLDDILSLGQKKRFKNGHVDTVYNILFRNGWKFRAFAKESNVGFLLRNVINATLG